MSEAMDNTPIRHPRLQPIVDSKTPSTNVRVNLVIIGKTLAPKSQLVKTSKEPGVSRLFVTPVVREELGFTKVD